MSSISHTHPEPSSESLERDARLITADHSKVAPGEIAEGKVTVKSMKDGTESRQPLGTLFDAVGSLLRA